MKPSDRTVLEEGTAVVADPLEAALRANYDRLVRLAAMLLDEPHLAEDVVQDAYVRVASRRYALRNPGQPMAYLRQVIVNQCHNTNRRSSGRRSRAETPEREDVHATTALVRAFERQDIVKALRTLPRRQREVVVLRHLGDLSVEETARELGISTGSVKAYTARALERLHTLMKEDS